jgi:hypothetical protein
VSSSTTAIEKSINILLVEDDDGDAKAVQRSFRKANIPYPILRAVDGIEALEMLKGTNGRPKAPTPLLLLVDLNLPRMNGLQFIQTLREDEELRHSIAFVLTTSKREQDKKAAYDLNVAGYIVKETAGQDFLNLLNLVESYRRIVETPYRSSSRMTTPAIAGWSGARSDRPDLPANASRRRASKRRSRPAASMHSIVPSWIIGCPDTTACTASPHCTSGFPTCPSSWRPARATKWSQPKP